MSCPDFARFALPFPAPEGGSREEGLVGVGAESRGSVCCGAAGVARLGVRVQERNLDHTQAPFAASERNGVHGLHPPAVASRARYSGPPRGRQWDEVSSFDYFLPEGDVLSAVPHINERLYPHLSGGID
jgi:hypothetical protein